MKLFSISKLFIAIIVIGYVIPMANCTVFKIINSPCVQGTIWVPIGVTTIQKWCYTCRCLVNNVSFCRAHIPLPLFGSQTINCGNNLVATIRPITVIGSTTVTPIPITGGTLVTTIRPVTVITPIPITGGLTGLPVVTIPIGPPTIAPITGTTLAPIVIGRRRRSGH